MKIRILSLIVVVFMSFIKAEAATWESLLNACSGNNNHLEMAILSEGEYSNGKEINEQILQSGYNLVYSYSVEFDKDKHTAEIEMRFEDGKVIFKGTYSGSSIIANTMISDGDTKKCYMKWDLKSYKNTSLNYFDITVIESGNDVSNFKRFKCKVTNGVANSLENLFGW